MGWRTIREGALTEVLRYVCTERIFEDRPGPTIKVQQNVFQTIFYRSLCLLTPFCDQIGRGTLSF